MVSNMRIVKYIFLILFFLFVYKLHAEDVNLQFAISMTTMSIQNGDYAGARKMLDKVSTQCEQSADWEIRYKYNLLNGEICYAYDKDVRRFNQYYQQALDAYPLSIPLTQDFMSNVANLCRGLIEDKCYEQAEKQAARFLVRGSSLADSCLYSSMLFSVLAKCYEHRGDTIMPKHFHGKAQELGFRYHILTTKADSIAIYNDRIDRFKQTMNAAKARFSKKMPNYLLMLNEYCDMIAQAGNLHETIYLAEKAISLATEMNMKHLDGACDAYFHLLYCYAFNKQLNEAERALHTAVEYFSRFPQKQVNEAVLLYQIGLGLMDSGQYSEAISYFERTRRLWNANQQEYREMIPQLIKQCKERL